jgi:glycosyltransferase involved in cell wall biosynthesis
MSVPQDTPAKDLRWVSVIAPCRNEAGHIHAFCDSALAQVLPPGWQMEVLVADGCSDDGTRELLAARSAQDGRLQWVDNPGRIVSTGLNACIARARGEVIVRLDIHTRFAPDYVARCIETLERTGADNVGGPWVAEGTGPMGRAVAAAFQCRWVVGGARSRDTRYDGEVDTVYLGCWPRAVFERVGGFDEALVRNQDDEHNLRLRLAGGRIWQSPQVHSLYHPRNSLRHLFAQQRQYGYWRPFVMRKHGQPGSVRQLVPAAFVAALALFALCTPWTALPLAALVALYAAYVGWASVSAARGADQRGLLARLPVVIAAYHVAYGLGTWRGLWDVLRARAPSAQFARITR